MSVVVFAISYKVLMNAPNNEVHYRRNVNGHFDMWCFWAQINAITRKSHSYFMVKSQMYHFYFHPVHLLVDQ